MLGGIQANFFMDGRWKFGCRYKIYCNWCPLPVEPPWISAYTLHF